MSRWMEDGWMEEVWLDELMGEWRGELRVDAKSGQQMDGWTVMEEYE